MTRVSRLVLVCWSASLLSAAPLFGQGKPARVPFFGTSVDPAAKLPADGIYPRGRKLAFAGYSGDPARDLANGFTVAGPVYGDQAPYLEHCFENRWPVVAHIGPDITFRDGDPARYSVDVPRLREQIQKQVGSLAAHKEIVWWAVKPEELRPWKNDEMQYLAVVCDAIRRADPQARPIYHYNPNHREATSLSTIARQVDILGKGCYVNSVGRKRDRAWVRWSVEQEVEAIRLAGRPATIPLLMPELCKDPEPAEDKEIRDWVRHDVYLGMASGAKGVLIWSLFNRKEVHRTWKTWHDAYAECAKELNGQRGLAGVFLFGQRCEHLKVRSLRGQSVATVTLGGSHESGTTSDGERAKREVKLATWSAAEFAYQGSHWLFLVNSANAADEFTVVGWPRGSRAENAFDASPVELGDQGPLRLCLPAYGVAAIRISPAAAASKSK